MTAAATRMWPGGGARGYGWVASCSTHSLSVTAALWMVPIAGAIFASFRPFQDTCRTVSSPGRTP